MDELEEHKIATWRGEGKKGFEEISYKHKPY